jgi:hypothetical protein
VTTSSSEPSRTGDARTEAAAKIRDIAETFLYDGDTDQPLPGYEALLDIGTPRRRAAVRARKAKILDATKAPTD